MDKKCEHLKFKSYNCWCSSGCYDCKFSWECTKCGRLFTDGDKKAIQRKRKLKRGK